jgi:hypothetical protein
MATKYIKYNLLPGQQAPIGNTGKVLQDGWIVWYGEESEFPEDMEHKEMTDEEIDYVLIKEKYHSAKTELKMQ